MLLNSVSDMDRRTPVPAEPPGFLGLVVKNLVAWLHGRGFEFVLCKRRRATGARRRLIRPARPAPAARDSVAIPDMAKLFTVEVEARPGINHLRFALELLVREAVALGRTPVAFRPRFDPRHNLGHDLVVDWDRYIDLENVELVDREAGTVTLVRLLVRREIEPPAPLSALWVERGHVVTESENGTWDLIARHNRTGLEVPAIHGGTAGLPGYVVRFRPSRRIVELAQAVIRQLGDYCAVHVRRDDMLEMTDRYPNLDRDTQPDRIGETLARVLEPGAAVYIMTNERDKSFFTPLKSRFRLQQYFDFPELNELVSGPEPDNFLLFEVEKKIFEAAALKVHTFTHPEGGNRLALTADKGWA